MYINKEWVLNNVSTFLFKVVLKDQWKYLVYVKTKNKQKPSIISNNQECINEWTNEW